jgi:hypothetical protein
MINDVIFNTPCDGGITGNTFYPNGYGASVTHIYSNETYNIGFLKQQDYYTWNCELDANLSTITQETEIYNLDETQVNNYLLQVKNL